MMEMIDAELPYSSGALYKKKEDGSREFLRAVKAGYEVEEDEEVFWRSASNILVMFSSQMTAKDIAKFLHVSEGWILLQKNNEKKVVAEIMASE